jgi:hypothetical protein
VQGGEEAAPCAWPTSVAIVYDEYAQWDPESSGVFCSGTLVHPELVVFASHCMDPWGNANPDYIYFGEQAGAPGFAADIDDCGAMYWDWQAKDDWAWCRLDEPVNLPVTPILYGCETDVLEAGTEIVTAAWGMPELGLKTWGRTPIEKVTGTTVVFGDGQQVGNCGGDSGSSGLLQLEDGSWRAFSIASILNENSGECGSITSARLDQAVPWLEEQSGLDLTPCHDVDGTWNPGPGCTQFFAGDEAGAGEWSNWCEGTPVSGPSTTCGAAMPDDAAPFVELVAPYDGKEFPEGPVVVPIEFDVDDPDGTGVTRVRLTVEGLDVEVTDDAAPWALDSIELPEGTWTLRLVGEDWAGNLGEDTAQVIVHGPQPEGDDTDDGEPEPEPEDSGETGDPSGELEMGDDADLGCGCQSGGPAAPWWAGLLFFWPLADRLRRRRR